jgi:LPXTG-site transpeptidase (sortase) family protein
MRDKITIDGSLEQIRKHRLHALMLGSIFVVLLIIGGVLVIRKLRSNIQQPTSNPSTSSGQANLPSVNATTVEPKSKDFGLVIEKINANAPVVKEVNPESESVYYKALEQGVAQWKGTPYPDQPGNMFIFGHSSFYEVAKGDYKDIFAPLDKVEKGDRFDIWYNNQKYTYEIVENKVVKDTDFSVLDGPTPNDKDDKTITIMTCWPPKTIAKRRVVFGKQV